MKRKHHFQPTPQLTAINGEIKELGTETALFEIVFCKCFEASCKCLPITIRLPKSQCKIKSDRWTTGTATVELPVWLLTKQMRNLGLR